MFYVGDKPWHKLGTQLDVPPTAEEAIRLAQLDWRVAKVPLFYHESIERVGVVPDTHAVIPTEGWPERERPVFGVVSDKYEPLQNAEAFAFFDPVVKEGHATYETAGALGKGERVWVLAKLADPICIKGDMTEKYLLLSNSHDGKSAVQIKFTPIRVVCNNTLTWALERNANYSIKHDLRVGQNMEQAKKLFANITCEYSNIEAKFNKLASVKVGEDRLKEYLGKIYPEPAKPDESDKIAQWERSVERSKQDRANCTQLYMNPEPLTVEDVRHTLWAAYNAVTEYVDHYSGQPANASKHLNSIWFGSRARDKAKAYEIAEQQAATWTG
ncbi:DUF932 domain-containing protein [Pontiella sulfatireligans]|uniref:Phage/plasmid-like protein n=1 Tax=Pontiella sulfatireligans TaxID=2750658 RepID=A0A6C2UPW3_9BACT|nr:DUF932 domain-containing protein [Pontiella sulfatireligans]VGO22315.1 hypothetical protein SCARR_04398 [Pontiella sulfatireligans]